MVAQSVQVLQKTDPKSSILQEHVPFHQKIDKSSVGCVVWHAGPGSLTIRRVTRKWRRLDNGACGPLHR